MAKKFEYYTWIADGYESSSSVNTVLNDMGKIGWELISCYTNHNGYIVHVFKKEYHAHETPKPQQTEQVAESNNFWGAQQANSTATSSSGNAYVGSSPAQTF